MALLYCITDLLYVGQAWENTSRHALLDLEGWLLDEMGKSTR